MYSKRFAWLALMGCWTVLAGCEVARPGPESFASEVPTDVDAGDEVDGQDTSVVDVTDIKAPDTDAGSPDTDTGLPDSDAAEDVADIPDSSDADAPQCQPANCDDGNPCTDDTCDVSKGTCVNAANVAACDDGNACTDADVCAVGACAGKNKADGEACGADEVCTAGVCAASLKCVLGKGKLGVCKLGF